MVRSRVCGALFSVGLAIFAAAAASAQPEGFSGLVGRTLTQDRSDVGGLLGDLLLSRHKGRIVSATVREDGEQILAIDVTYAEADLSEPKFLTGVVQGPDGETQRVSAADVPLTAPAGTVRLELRLRPNLPESTTFDSSKLVVRIRAQGGAKYDAASLFALPKRWSVAVRPENRVIEVTPAAVGDIPANDPAIAATPAPPRILRPETMMLLRGPLVLSTATAAPTGDTRSGRRTIMVAPGVLTGLATAPPRPTPTRNTTHMVTISPAALAGFHRLPPVGDSSGLPPAVTDKGGHGPSSQALRIFDTLRAAPGIGLTADKLTSIGADLYRDANPASGIFYYLPARYTLYWDADNGYALRFLYGAAAQPETAGTVSVTARLTSGIDAQELELLKKLLRAALPADVFKELKPFPFAGTPGFSFKDDLRRFDIPAEKVSISAISDLAGEVDLAFVTDTVTKDMLELTLTEGLGLTGTATFTSATGSGNESFSRTIPVQMRVADPRSFGTRYWKRGEMLANDTPFPLLLKHVHFLTLATDGTPTVYSYSLGSAELAPRARARFVDGPIRSWLDGRALRAWVDYTVREDYPAGVEKAKSDWNGGLGQLSTTSVKLTTLTPFTEPGGIARILVDVKSKYFEPQSRSEAIRSVALTHDNESATIGPVFLVNRSVDEVGREGDPLFSFRLSVVKPDGDVAGPGAWTNGDRLEVFLGSRHVRDLLGPVPTAATPTTAP